MILAIDQGTSGTTCLVLDEEGEPLSCARAGVAARFPQAGWVELDAEEIWRSVREASAAALTQAGVRVGELTAVGIANQRETVVTWDPVSGEPLHHALAWQDRRTAEHCRALREAGHEPLVRERTGLILDPYFSATKIQWLLECVPDLARRASTGRAVFGTVDAWLLFKLTGEHLTDSSNASRTLLCDTSTGRWDAELLALFGEIPARSLPTIVASCGPLARTRSQALHGHVVPVTGVAGDQQAALFGQACLEPGMGKATYGTGAFVLVNDGTRRPPAAPGLLSTVAWRIGARTDYALEGSILVAGAAVSWLRDGLGIIAEAAETERLAASLVSNDGVHFVPALSGLGSPHWDPYARGTIIGLTGGTTRAHLARATLEAIAQQTADAVAAIEAAGQPLRELRVDGGAAVNGWLMQFQADLLGVPVLVHEISETTALGAGQLAGVGADVWTLDAVERGWRPRMRFEPAMEHAEREHLRAQWRRAVERAQGWADPDAGGPAPSDAGLP